MLNDAQFDLMRMRTDYSCFESNFSEQIFLILKKETSHINNPS